MSFDETSRSRWSEPRERQQGAPDAAASRLRASASLISLLVTLIVLSACGGSSTGELVGSTDFAQNTAAQLPPTQTPPQTPTPQLDDQAPAPFPSLVVATADGGQIDFGSLAGQDTVLWFWAPW